jgi:predicted RNase H-like HicB family nuclease
VSGNEDSAALRNRRGNGNGIMATLSVEDYKKMPYSRCFVPEEDGTFSAYVRELPGCYSCGDTIEEAYENLQDAMHNWLEASIGAGHTIPPPLEDWHEQDSRAAQSAPVSGN